MRPSTSSWDANPRRTISRFVFHAEDQIRPHCTLYLSALSSDLELWSYQHHPRVMYCTYYTLLGIAAVRLGPGRLWDHHPLKAFQIIPVRDTSYWIFMWCVSPTSHLSESPCCSEPGSHFCYAFCRKACFIVSITYRCHQQNPAVKESLHQLFLQVIVKLSVQVFQTFVKNAILLFCSILFNMYFIMIIMHKTILLFYHAFIWGLFVTVLSNLAFIIPPAAHPFLSFTVRAMTDDFEVFLFLRIWKAQELMGIQVTFFSLFDVWHK